MLAMGMKEEIDKDQLQVEDKENLLIISRGL